jgi:hypothetical protein
VNGGPPAQAIYQLTYVGKGLASGAAFVDVIYNTCSLYDPLVSGSGHQPRYFDQLTPALYNAYRVLWVDVVVKTVTEVGTNSMPYTMALIPTTQASAFTSSYVPEELAEARWTMAEEDQVKGLRARFYPHEIMGFSISEWTNDVNSQAQYNANPAWTPYLHLFFCSVDTSTNVTVGYVISLKYTCVLEQRPSSTYSVDSPGGGGGAAYQPRASSSERSERSGVVRPPSSRAGSPTRSDRSDRSFRMV